MRRFCWCLTSLRNWHHFQCYTWFVTFFTLNRKKNNMKSYIVIIDMPLPSTIQVYHFSVSSNGTVANNINTKLYSAIAHIFYCILLIGYAVDWMIRFVCIEHANIFANHSFGCIRCVAYHLICVRFLFYFNIFV